MTEIKPDKGDQFDKNARKLYPLLDDLYTVQASYQSGNRLSLSLSPRYLEAEKSAGILEDRLKLAGYDFEIKRGEDNILLLDIDPRRKLKIPRLNIILFIITLITVYIVPVLLKNIPGATIQMLPHNFNGHLSFLDELSLTIKSLPIAFSNTLHDLGNGAGLEFTIAIISILFVHEMGHFIASRRRNIVTSWPYFIPAPNIIGTFGAIIKSKSPFWNRRDLIEVGAAGPIAGWIMAVGWLIYGLSQSAVLPANAFSLKDMAFSLYGESILITYLAPVLIGVAREGYFYKFTEAAFAGWVGLLVTAINMLPIGQLDGGHVLYGLMRRRQKYYGWAAMAALLILGFTSPLWWFFAGFGLIFGVAHPPTLDDYKEPNRTAFILGIAALIILVISFTPIPFRFG